MRPHHRNPARSDGDGIRAFLALEIPERLRQQLAAEQSRLRQILPPARWVRTEGIHLTLKFLGEAQRKVLDALAADLGPALAGSPPVEVRLAGSGFFPKASRPRVAWIGGTAEGAAEMVYEIERVAARHGFERERRRWSLHLTLARFREGWPPAAVESFLDWGSSLNLEPFTCSEVVLFQSVLKPTGAVYTALQRLMLESGTPSGSCGGEA